GRASDLAGPESIAEAGRRIRVVYGLCGGRLGGSYRVGGGMSREAKKMLKIETDHEGVCALIFDAEGETVNTLRAEFAQEFTEAFNVIEADESIRAVVLLSAKPDNFVAGADISMLAKVTSAHEASELSRIGQ